MASKQGGLWGIVAFVVALLALTTVVVYQRSSQPILAIYWTCGAAVIGACLVAFMVGKRFGHLPVCPGRVLCIVPVYNEPVESLRRTVLALVGQTVPVDVVVIDDGSETPVEPLFHHERVQWWRQANTGKRGAQVAVLRQIPRDTYQFVLTVDSDSEPFPDACEHLLRAMSDPGVQAATGMIYVRNHRASWVSLAADIDIGSSCVMMRASRSMLGALETTSGALALYRSELLFDHLDAYAIECGTGDDRWLALRALRRGEVVGVAEAGVETDMPTTQAGTYRQRLRWARSWWWMLPYVFRRLSVRQIASPLLGLMQLAIGPIVLIAALANIPGVWNGASGEATSGFVLLYAGSYVAVRYGLAGLYLASRPDIGRREALSMLFVGTLLAILLNLFLLSPTRYWALTRLFDNRWHTRGHDPNTPRHVAAGNARATANPIG
jgi:hyaluronan synthase